MATIEQHRLAIETLEARPTDPAAAEQLFNLAVEDPAGASAALEEITRNEPLARRFIPSAITPSIEEFVATNIAHTGTPVAPRSLDDLRLLMTQAATEWRTLRAIGAGYSFTDSDNTDGYRVVMSRHLQNILQLEVDTLKTKSDFNLLHFEAGATIGTLNHYLWNLFPKKALMNQPGYERLTFLGVATSGGHGSGVRLAPICDSILSFRVLTFDKDHNLVMKQVERSSGITDRAAFEAKHPDIELIQEDELFNAMLVGIGCLGIVYSIVVEIRSAFFLREDRVLRRWEDVRLALPAMLADEEIHSLHVWLNPYMTDGKQDCVVSEYRLGSGPPHGERGYGIRFGGAQAVVDVMLWSVRNHPDSTPGLVSSSIKATTATDVVMPCWEALNFGPPNLLRSLGTDYGVDVADTVAAADALSRAFQEYGRLHKAYLLSPFGIRFTKATTAFMAPSYGRDTCMIEMPLLDGLPRREELLALYIKTMETFGGRPHWGQLNTVDAASVKALFPRFDAFESAFRRMNASGLFDNDLTRRLGLSGTPVDTVVASTTVVNGARRDT